MTKVITFIFSAIFLILNQVVYCQDNRNLQEYTPAAMLKKKSVEVKLFNALYTDNSSFNNEGVIVKNNNRQTYFTAFVQTLYGIGNRVSIGVDAQIKSVRVDEASSSPFKVLRFENTGNSRTALSYIGPKVKLSPFKKLEFFSIQSTLFIPVAGDLQGAETNRPWLTHNGFQWWNQFFYDLKLSEKFRMFFEFDTFISLDREFNKDNNSILTPVKTFLSFFPTKKITVYTLAEFGPSWGNSKINSYYSQLGIGTKYQLIKNLELELMYSKFPVGKNSGVGSTLNLGIRFIK